MKPKVRRRTAVRKRSGRLVISRPSRWMRPAVGRAMAPIRASRVVFPEPLGPFSTVSRAPSTARLTSSMAVKALGRPSLKTLRTRSSRIISQALITASGSTMEACQAGTRVAAV